MFITRKVWPNPGKIISQMAKLQNSDSDALRKAQGMFSHIWNVSKCEIHYQYRTQNEKINQTPKKNKKKIKNHDCILIPHSLDSSQGEERRLCILSINCTLSMQSSSLIVSMFPLPVRGSFLCSFFLFSEALKEWDFIKWNVLVKEYCWSFYSRA